MLTNIVRNLFSPKAPNAFEKARNQATNTWDYEPPLEKDLEVILDTLSSKNPEIKGFSAFYLIIAKIQTSSSKKYWNYIIKNLTLFDRSIEERKFTQEISELDLPEVEGYKSEVAADNAKKIDLLVKRYFRYIKGKGRIYNTKHLPFDTPFEQRKKLLESIDHGKLLLDCKRLKSLVILAFDVFEVGSQANMKFRLNQYVFLLILNTLVGALSMQYTIFVIFLESLVDLKRSLIEDFHLIFKEFLQDADKLKDVCDRLSFIPRFQIPRDQICSPEVGANVLKLVEDYLEELRIQAPNQVSNLKRMSSDIQSQHLNLRNTRIDLTSFVEVLLSQPRGDNGKVSTDDECEDIDSDTSEESTTNMQGTSASKLAATKNRSDIKSPVKAFRKTFKVGYKSYMETEDGSPVRNRVDLIPKDISEGDMGDETQFRTPKKMTRELPTPLFSELLHLEEKDEMFEQFENFYSNEYLNQLEKQYSPYSARKKPNALNRLNTHGHLPEEDEVVCVQNGLEVIIVKDFDQDLFDSFKNTYSNS